MIILCLSITPFEKLLLQLSRDLHDCVGGSRVWNYKDGWNTEQMDENLHMKPHSILQSYVLPLVTKLGAPLRIWMIYIIMSTYL